MTDIPTTPPADSTPQLQEPLSAVTLTERLRALAVTADGRPDPDALAALANQIAAAQNTLEQDRTALAARLDRLRRALARARAQASRVTADRDRLTGAVRERARTYATNGALYLPEVNTALAAWGIAPLRKVTQVTVDLDVRVTVVAADATHADQIAGLVLDHHSQALTATGSGTWRLAATALTTQPANAPADGDLPSDTRPAPANRSWTVTTRGQVILTLEKTPDVPSAATPPVAERTTDQIVTDTLQGLGDDRMHVRTTWPHHIRHHLI